MIFSPSNGSDGTLYFACSVGDHCMGGTQKVMINLVPYLGQSLEPTGTDTISKALFGLSGEACAAIHNGQAGEGGDAGDVSMSMDSECSEPELMEDGRYHSSCLSPPAVLTPGGVINNLFVMHYPYPKDRRVLVGLRTWEFVMDTPEGGIEPVPINQLYVHHLSGRVILGQGTEGIRRSEPDAPYPPPYGVVTGDEGDTMIFHIIDLRDVDDWLACIECRCKDDEGSYLTSAFAARQPSNVNSNMTMANNMTSAGTCEDALATSPACQFGGLCECEEFVNHPDSTGCGGVFSSEMGDLQFNDMCASYCDACPAADMSATQAPQALTGGVSCCFNCTDQVGPTIDYRMRYNVSYSNITNDNPVQELIMLTADISPVVEKNIEFDVPPYPLLSEDFQKLEDPKVQRLVREIPFRELFQHEFFGDAYYGPEEVRLFRCVAHLHVAAMGMYLEDSETGERLCNGETQYGTDPAQDKGLLKAVHVDNYEEPKVFPADRVVRLITEYNATEVHTGVMGMYFIFIDGENLITSEDADLKIELCLQDTCDVGMLPQLTTEDVIAAMSQCEDTLPGSPACTFGNLCNCEDLISGPDGVGCGNEYVTGQGSIDVNSVCAKSCDCPAAANVTAGAPLCQDALAESPACRFGGLCECEEFVNSPDSTGCGGVFTSEMGDIPVNDMCASYCDACPDAVPMDEMMKEEFAKQLEEDLKAKCKYSTKECREALMNTYACSVEAPGIEAWDGDEDSRVLQQAIVTHGGRLADKYSKLGSSTLHRGEDSQANADVPPCAEGQVAADAGAETETGSEAEAETGTEGGTEGGGEAETLESTSAAALQSLSFLLSCFAVVVSPFLLSS